MHGGVCDIQTCTRYHEGNQDGVKDTGTGEEDGSYHVDLHRPGPLSRSLLHLVACWNLSK